MGYLSDLDGTQSNGGRPIKFDFLYPEEALFLVENVGLYWILPLIFLIILKLFSFLKSNLVVKLNMRENSLKVALSVQQCYDLMFSRTKSLQVDANNDSSQFNIDLNCFKIYSSLVKSGFIVRRAKKIQDKKPAETAKTSTKSSPISSVARLQQQQIKPIVNKSDHEHLTQSDIYKRLERLIPNVSLDELKDRLGSKLNDAGWHNRSEQVFEVNQPDKRFQKSKPPKSDFTIFTPIDESTKMIVPGLADFVAHAETKRQIYAFADDANHPIFYSFDFNFNIPSIFKE